MTSQQLIDAIRIAQSLGRNAIGGILHCKIRGVKNICFTNLDGAINGNPHDVWVKSKSGNKVLGRIYLGSKKMPADTEGWENSIAEVK